MSKIKYKWDNNLGVLEVSILERNYNSFDSLLLVKETIIGNSRIDFPNQKSYYTYGDYYNRYRVNQSNRSMENVISTTEWNNYKNTKEEVLSQMVYLYNVNIFNSTKPYSYASFKELEIDNYAKVNVKGRIIDGLVVSKIGKASIEKVLENRISFIE